MIDPKEIKAGTNVVCPVPKEEGRDWISASFLSLVENGIRPTNYASVSSTDRRIRKNYISVQLGNIYSLPPRALSEKTERANLWTWLHKTPDWDGKKKDIEEILDSWDGIKLNYNTYRQQNL